MENTPLVSVIVPAYNAEAFIEQTLISVLDQTYRNIEVLVVDDGSQDSTAQIVKSIAYKDHRVNLFQQSNAGVAAARNLAIQKSQGRYVAPIDADDVWYPQKIKKQMQCMLEADPSVGLVYAWSAYIDEQGSLTGGRKTSRLEAEVYLALISGNFVGSASAPLIRRVCFEEAGYYNYKLREQNAQGCEDWDLYLRIAEHYQFRVVPEFLIGYRQIASSMSCNFSSMAKSYFLVMTDAQQRHPEIPAIAYQWSRSSFYEYLAVQSNRCGKHWNALFWTYKSLRMDPTRCFLDLQLYKLSIKSFIKLMAQPVASLVWPNHDSWIKFKRQLRKKYYLNPAADINKTVNEYQQNPKNRYSEIKLQRWSQLINTLQHH